MGEFSAEWLRLRASADIRARAGDLPLLLRPRMAQFSPLRVLDLGCGTGSNLRALAPKLGDAQEWLCLDANQGLLDQIAPEIGAWTGQTGYVWNADNRSLAGFDPDFRCVVQTVRFDLAPSLADLPLEGVGLLTASALLDLVSDDWLCDLVSRCARSGAPMLFTLTYDGRIDFEPELSIDRDVVVAVNAHQHRDKGFGPALGPAATRRLATLACGHGYWVEIRLSDWRIGRSERALQNALIQGWCEAACEQAPERTDAFQHWKEIRQNFVQKGFSRIQVGHRDLLAIPRGLGSG